MVSAASIIAKVTRDRLLREWTFDKSITLDKNFGSGYPSDEICVKWLERSFEPVFGFPNIVRHSWATIRDVTVKMNGVEVKWECDEEHAEGSEGVDITSFFEMNGQKRMKRTSYFNRKKFKHILPNDFIQIFSKTT